MDILGINLNVYGLVIALAIWAGAWVSRYIARNQGKNPDLVINGLVWIVSLGIIGARLYHVVDALTYYSANPLQVFMLWRGGLGIYGAIIGGVFGLILYWLVNKPKLIEANISWLWLLDIAAISMPLGQAIGRWGNWVNQELFGVPTNLPWGIFIHPANRPLGMEQSTNFHPLFFYESMLSLGLFSVIWFLYRSVAMYQFIGTKRWQLGEGRYLGMYLMGYGLIRLILEPMRIESWMVGEIRVASILSVIMIICGGLLVMHRWAKYQKNPKI